MALPSSTVQMEHDKFVEDASGDVAVRALISSGDIQIGAVEIKNSTSDTRAAVGSDGLHVDPQTLPPDAATETKQDDIITELQTLTGEVGVNGLAVDVKAITSITGTVSVSNMIPAVETGLATSTKQDDIITELQHVETDVEAVVTALGTKADEWVANDVDDYTTTSVTYVGKEKKDGTWWMMKLDETGTFLTINHASVTNNPTLTSYTLAWAARTTATYADYASAF